MFVNSRGEGGFNPTQIHSLYTFVLIYIFSTFFIYIHFSTLTGQRTQVFSMYFYTFVDFSNGS